MYQRQTDERLPEDSSLDRIRGELFSAGYVVLPSFVESDVLDALRIEARRLSMELAGETDATVISRDEGGRLLSMHYLDRHSDLLFDLTRLPEVVELAETLLESRCVPFLTEYFATPEPTAETTPAHQDQIFHRDHFGDELGVAFWIALNDVTDGDAVLEYATEQPAVGELLAHRVFDAQTFRAELANPTGFGFRSALVPASGAVVHHSYAVHRYGRKSSAGPREAFVLNFRRSPYRQQIRPWAR